jgi:hypothetical protein
MNRKEFLKRFVGTVAAIPVAIEAMNEELPTQMQQHPVEEVHLPFDEEAEYKQFVHKDGKFVEIHQRPPNNTDEYPVGSQWICKNMTSSDVMTYIYTGEAWLLV